MESANNILPSKTDVQKAFILKKYKIGFSKCKLTHDHKNHTICGNPHCFYNIKALHVNEKLEYKLRKKDTFVGLKNLGATCYINSLLQLWFHNINIRNVILNWDPKQDKYKKVTILEKTYDPKTVLSNLQFVFAEMQFGNQKTIDPQPFVKSLDIIVKLQEDSEEFENFLITLFWEENVDLQSNMPIREMIKDNFFGESNSVTLCLNCKNESVKTSQLFREIDLNIQSYNTVTDSLDAHFKKQTLTGDDKYSCVKCKSKQNADSHTLLTSLPNLVHLKLMRYVYDKDLNTTIKINTVVRCPYTIDMGKYFCVSCESSKGEHVYSLYGVLIHKGKYANVGHFITHIKDLKTEQWYEMDDENVKMLNTYDSNLYDECIFEELASIKSINIHSNEYKTNNAYMLVYMKTSLVMKLKTESSDFTLSPKLTNFIKSQNSNYEERLVYEDYTIEPGKMISKLVKEIVCSEVKNDEGEAISYTWLVSLAETKPTENVCEIDNTSIECPHNKLNPNALHVTKYIGTKLADKLYHLYQGGPRLKINSSLCDLCVRNRSALLCMGKLTKGDQQFISEILDSINNNIDDKNNEQTFWLGILSSQCWQIKYLKMFENFLKLHLILPKATLPINKQFLVASCKSLIGILDDTLVGIEENNIETDNDTDSILSELDYDIGVYKDDTLNDYFESLEIERTRIMFDFNANINNYVDNIYYIENTENVPWTLNEDITCPHGNLCIAKETMILVPQQVKAIFQSYFPKVELFPKNTKPCSICKAYYKNVYNPKMIDYMSSALQRNYLDDLICDDTRPNSTEENCPYYCIPKDFLESWQRYVAKPREEPKPLMINNKSLLCQDHNELLFEPKSNFVATDQSVSVIITKKEWINLLNFYEADCGIFAYFDKNGKFQKSIPKVCGICYTIPDYTIYIKVNPNYLKCHDTDSNFEGNSVKKFKQDVSTNHASEYEAASASTINIYNSTSDYGTRRIERQAPKYRSITISSNDTVFSLKNKIEKLFNVLPANQILETVTGKPLIDNEAKLRDLQINPESVIVAKFIDANLTKNVAVEGTEFKGSPLLN